MLDLRRDLFARLVISSHRDKKLNKSFRLIGAEKSNAIPIKKLEENYEEDSEIEKELPNMLIRRQVAPIPVLNVAKVSEESSNIEKAVSDVSVRQQTVQTFVQKSPATEKIDEKVTKIVDDPVLSEIRTELEFAETLLKKIKSLDRNNSKIPVIEANISKFKAMLEQKMYV
jgi:aromatic ring-opening dioxygenase LigB subunit